MWTLRPHSPPQMFKLDLQVHRNYFWKKKVSMGIETHQLVHGFVYCAYIAPLKFERSTNGQVETFCGVTNSNLLCARRYMKALKFFRKTLSAKRAEASSTGSVESFTKHKLAPSQRDLNGVNWFRCDF